MKKKPNKIIGIIVLILIVLFLGRNMIIKLGAEAGVKAVTGLPLEIGKFKTGLFSTNIDIQDFKLKNPKGYTEPVMVSIPQIYVDYSLMPLLTGKVHLQDIKFHLEEFVVVQKADGSSNLDTLKALQETQKTKTDEKPKADKKEGKAPEVAIENLSLKIERVKFIKYNESGEAKVKEYNIGIDESYTDIKNLNAVVALIVFKSLAKTPIALANIDLGGLGDALGGTLGTATAAAGKVLGTTTETAGKALDEAKGALTDSKDKLKGIIKSPFGK